MIPIAMTLVGIVTDVNADQAKAASPYDKGSVSIDNDSSTNDSSRYSERHHK